MTDDQAAPAAAPDPTPGWSDAALEAAVLAAVDAERDHAIALLADLVAVPSTGGSQAECDVQHLVAEVLAGDGFDTQVWDLDLDALTAVPEFPGMEVERTAAYGGSGSRTG